MTIVVRDRLAAFYRSYLTAIDQYEWIRVSLFSGLAGYDLTRRYVMTRVEGLLKIMVRELKILGSAGGCRHDPMRCTRSFGIHIPPLSTI